MLFETATHNTERNCMLALFPMQPGMLLEIITVPADGLFLADIGAASGERCWSDAGFAVLAASPAC